MKTTLYMAQTLNGYIAKKNGDTPWSEEVWKSYYQIAKKFKAIILGRKTYEVMKEVNEFEKIGNPFTIVLSKSNKSSNDKNINFVKSPKEAIKLLEKNGFKEALIGGGSKLNASFMKENLINEIILDIEPQIFGNGIKLFEEGKFEAKLKLKAVKNISENVVQLCYEVVK